MSETARDARLAAEIEEIAADSALNERQKKLLTRSIQSSSLSDRDLWRLARRLLKEQRKGKWIVSMVFGGVAALLTTFFLVIYGFGDLNQIQGLEGLSPLNSVGVTLLLAAFCVGGAGFVAIELATLWYTDLDQDRRGLENVLVTNLPPEVKDEAGEETEAEGEESS